MKQARHMCSRQEKGKGTDEPECIAVGKARNGKDHMRQKYCDMKRGILSKTHAVEAIEVGHHMRHNGPLHL